MNNDLIRRNDTFKSIANDGDEHWWYEERINEVPAVDAVEVVHGRWIVIDDDYGWDSEIEDEFYYVIECECSECHERVKLDRPNYCPNCGARMDGNDNV